MNPNNDKAVFLSYASEDAEAARRICDALRAAGIEAWFDESELRGGDAWDQKIRRQIKGCALFMPLISSTTDARTEGYFRLEWRLAVERSHLLADDAPFIVPVAIDGCSEAQARVPDRFREVQWMRLGKDSPESIAARIRKLLAGEAAPERLKPRSGPKRSSLRYIGAGIAILFALVAIIVPLVKPKSDRNLPAATMSAVTDASRLAQRALDVIKSLDYTRAGLTAAGEDARKASELDPSLALAWGARARVEATWLQRLWDMSEQRRHATQEFARRALAIDPQEANALWSQAMVLGQQGAQKEAEALLRRALKSAPDDNFIRRSLGGMMFERGQVEDAIANHEEILRRDPRDPLAHYGIAFYHLSQALKDDDTARIDLAMDHVDRSINIKPLLSALLWKANLQAAWKGDFEAADATLERVAALPLEQATEDRAIFFRMWIPILEKEPQKALAASALTTTTYFSDAQVRGPIAWLKAFAHRQAGRESAAAEEWRAAEAVLRARLAADPNSLVTQAELAVTHAMQGRKDEAVKEFSRYDAWTRERGMPGSGAVLHMRFHAAMGDARRTVAAVKEVRKRSLPYATKIVLQRDPWFDRVRGQPEFKALMRELDGKKAA